MRPWLQNLPGAQARPRRPGGDRVRSPRPGLTRDARLLVAGQGVRAAGYGFTAVLLGAGAPLWVLLVVALTGTLSTDVVDNGPATTLEQAMLASEDAGTATVYGRYNAVGAAAGALGPLAVTLPGLGPHRVSGAVHAWLFLVLVPVGITGA